jgi:hypothetical protein
VKYTVKVLITELRRAINGPGCQMILPVKGEDEEGVYQFLWYMDCDFKGRMDTHLHQLYLLYFFSFLKFLFIFSGTRWWESK